MIGHYLVKAAERLCAPTPRGHLVARSPPPTVLVACPPSPSIPAAPRHLTVSPAVIGSMQKLGAVGRLREGQGGAWRKLALAVSGQVGYFNQNAPWSHDADHLRFALQEGLR